MAGSTVVTIQRLAVHSVMKIERLIVQLCSGNPDVGCIGVTIQRLYIQM